MAASSFSGIKGGVLSVKQPRWGGVGLPGPAPSRSRGLLEAASSRVLCAADCLVGLVVMERSDTQAIKPLSSPARGRARATSVIVGREQIFRVTRLTLSPVMSSARQLLTRLTQVPQRGEPGAGVSTAAGLGPRQPPSRPPSLPLSSRPRKRSQPEVGGLEMGHLGELCVFTTPLLTHLETERQLG